MQYILFVGIFGLPILVCVGMLAARILDGCAPDEVPEPGVLGNSRLPEIGSRESDLADTFFTAPVEQTPPQ
ncbi:MAG: hypothetical protein A2Z31_10525 [candidate division NC10 bacterium RBG_16_65_8]|nr:MAG: hypothetical protein A2Z31_10525 [candidate division NC10 bacterium RBG_16_65_8]